MTRVAVLGIGLMGEGMARRLLGAGFGVTVWNRRRERARPLEGDGAAIAASPREAAAAADVILSMVADDAASRAVWLGEQGALGSARPSSLVIESSTVSPGWIEELAGDAAARGCVFLEAPVTGSRQQAADGELLFLAGGDPAALERARPVLHVLGKSAVHLGRAGSGARLKLVNNFLCGVQAAALAEAVVVLERCGLAGEPALSVLMNGAPGSPLVRAVLPRMMGGDYAARFLLALMRKDLAYASAEAAALGAALETAAPAARLFDEAIARGWGDRDFSSVVEAARARRAGRDASGLPLPT